MTACCRLIYHPRNIHTPPSISLPPPLSFPRLHGNHWCLHPRVVEELTADFVLTIRPIYTDGAPRKQQFLGGISNTQTRTHFPVYVYL